MPNNDEILWNEIIKNAIATIIYATTGAIAFYQAAKRYIDSVVQNNIVLIDSRAALKSKEDKEDLERKNKELEERIKEVERDFKDFNEERMRELRELLKNYK